MKIKITVTTGSTAVVSAITFDPVPPTSTAPASRVFAQTGSLGRLLGSMPDGTPINLQYHTDAHGNVTALSDAYGNLSTAYYTDAWGNVIAGSSTQNPYVNAGNHGYWQDADLGLNYVRARWLNPETGTWLSVDPVQGEPRYNYAGNSPTVRVDPSGRASAPTLQQLIDAAKTPSAIASRIKQLRREMASMIAGKIPKRMPLFEIATILMHVKDLSQAERNLMRQLLRPFIAAQATGQEQANNELTALASELGIPTTTRGGQIVLSPEVLRRGITGTISDRNARINKLLYEHESLTMGPVSFGSGGGATQPYVAPQSIYTGDPVRRAANLRRLADVERELRGYGLRPPNVVFGPELGTGSINRTISAGISGKSFAQANPSATGALLDIGAPGAFAELQRMDTYPAALARLTMQATEPESLIDAAVGGAVAKGLFRGVSASALRKLAIGGSALQAPSVVSSFRQGHRADALAQITVIALPFALDAVHGSADAFAESDPDLQDAPSARSAVYRVQGGEKMPKVSQERIAVARDGSPLARLTVRGKNKLYVIFDDPERARQYLRKYRSGGYIISYEVDPEFVQLMRDKAIAQGRAKSGKNRLLPEIADPGQTTESVRASLGLKPLQSTAYGLPANWIEILEESALPRTGAIIR